MRRILLLVFDLILVAAATLLAFALRENFEIEPERWGAIGLYTSLTLVPALAVLGLTGTYRTSWRHLSVIEYRALVSCAFVIVVSAQFAGFAVTRLENVARAVPLLQILLIPLLLVGVRVLYKSYRSVRRAARALPVDAPLMPAEAVLLVGVNPIAELYVASVRQFTGSSKLVAGVITERVAAERGKFVYGLPVLGNLGDIPRAVQELEMHGVYVSRLVLSFDPKDLSPNEAAALDALAGRHNLKLDVIAERLGLIEAVSQAAPVAVPEFVNGHAATATVTALPLMDVEIATRRPYWAFKRALDIVAALALLIGLAPVMLVVAIVTAASLGFPVVFWQFRPGRFGREFKLYKFRTMRESFSLDGRLADDQLRQSAFGRFLRATRLDELPQLVNVLRGEMSFVGPRPLVTVEQTSIPSARLLVRPGLTGWAQIKGGRAVSVADKAALDLWYIRNASFWLDVRILLATVRMVVRGDQTDLKAITQAWSAGGPSDEVPARRRAN